MEHSEDNIESRQHDLAYTRAQRKEATGRPLKPFEPMQVPGDRISDTILEDREDRF